jgi:hypothetical protein
MSIFDKYPRLLDPMFVESYDLEECWTRKSEDGSFAEEDVAVALIRTSGNFSATARLLVRARRSTQTFIVQNTFLRDLREDLRNEFLDVVEDAYMNDALKGVPGARHFFLTTLGKDRGYVQRQETTGKDGEPLYKQSAIDPKDLSEEALEAIMKAHNSAS